MSPSRSRAARAVCLAMLPALAAGAQSSVTVSPFVSYVPSAATNPLAGFALTFGGTTGLAFRSGAEISISNPRIDSAASGGYRPWGADADAMLFLGGLGGGATVFQRALSPYLFSGIGLTGGDSAGRNVVQHGWSYGFGASLPLGLDADLFAEARWRMSEYVLPTSQGAPDSRSALRFGLSFLVGGGGTPRGTRPRRGHRMEVAEADDAVEYVVTSAPAPQPVVIVQQAPAPPPQTVIIQQPAPVIVRQGPVIAPTIIIGGERHARTRTRVVHVQKTVRVTPKRRVVAPRTETRSTVRPQTQARPPQTTMRRVTTPATRRVETTPVTRPRVVPAPRRPTEQRRNDKDPDDT